MKYDAEQLSKIASDSTFHDIGVLPSQGIPYKGRMEKLFIRPFRFSEMTLLSKAAQLKEPVHLIRAVDACISHDVYDLTIGDFYYVLFWLRMYSMPSSPYILEWYCNQPYFTHKETKQALFYTEDNWPNSEQLEADYNVAMCDTHNTSTVHFPGLDIICLEEDYVLPEGLDWPRVAILENLQAALLDADMSMLAPALQWMPGITWDAKIAAADADGLDGFKLFAKALEVNKTVQHGISETVTFNCRKCRVEHTQTLKLDALSFFQ